MYTLMPQYVISNTISNMLHDDNNESLTINILARYEKYIQP